MTSWRCVTCWPVKFWRRKMMSLVNKSADWTPNYHKILIFFPTKSLKSLCAARIDELADSKEPATKNNNKKPPKKTIDAPVFQAGPSCPTSSFKPIYFLALHLPLIVHCTLLFERWNSNVEWRARFSHYNGKGGLLRAFKDIMLYSCSCRKIIAGNKFSISDSRGNSIIKLNLHWLCWGEINMEA